MLTEHLLGARAGDATGDTMMNKSGNIPPFM